jgi:hypothetical protein
MAAMKMAAMKMAAMKTWLRSPGCTAGIRHRRTGVPRSYHPSVADPQWMTEAKCAMASFRHLRAASVRLD